MADRSGVPLGECVPTAGDPPGARRGRRTDRRRRFPRPAVAGRGVVHPTGRGGPDDTARNRLRRLAMLTHTTTRWLALTAGLLLAAGCNSDPKSTPSGPQQIADITSGTKQEVKTKVAPRTEQGPQEFA